VEHSQVLVQVTYNLELLLKNMVKVSFNTEHKHLQHLVLTVTVVLMIIYVLLMVKFT